MDNDNMNFEDLLKKAFDNKAPEEENTMPDSMKAIVNFIEKGSLIKLAKAAREKMDEIIDQLVKDVDKTGKLPYDDTPVRCRKVIDTAKKLEILHTIVMAAGVVGISSEDAYDENVDMIIKLCTL